MNFTCHNISDLRMTFHGKAYVHWTEPTMRGPGEIRFKEIQHYSATEEYFEVSKSLLSHGEIFKKAGLYYFQTLDFSKYF